VHIFHLIVSVIVKTSTISTKASTEQLLLGIKKLLRTVVVIPATATNWAMCTFSNEQSEMPGNYIAISTGQCRPALNQLPKQVAHARRKLAD
jgi:hypothetical protein